VTGQGQRMRKVAPGSINPSTPMSRFMVYFLWHPFCISEVFLRAKVLIRRLPLWALVGLAILGLVITIYIVGTQRYSSEAPPPTSQIGGFRPSTGEPIFGERVSSLEEMQARVPFSVPLPNYMPDGGVLSEVWAGQTRYPPEQRHAALVYSNGIWITFSLQSEIVPDWKGLVDEPNSPFRLIKVNGIEGIGKDPGDQVLYGGEIHHYPGSVGWKAGHLLIAVYGEYPMEELLRVAESMEIR